MAAPDPDVPDEAETATDALLRHAAAATDPPADLAAPPARRVVIVTCMDARIDPAALLGLRPGDAHVLRNAGGVVTDDVIRSLTISQRELATREVMLVHHTRCGMLTLSDTAFRDAIGEETGVRPPWPTEAFSDLDAAVREAMARVRSSPFLPHRDRVRGFVYEVETGRLREVR
jgi:carbonic anhydrase